MTTKNFNVKNGLTTGNILLDAASGNISSTNANLGNLVTANYFSGAGNLLSNIVGGNVTGQVANALVAGTVYTNAQPNITSVGTLTSLTSGLITATSGGIKVGNIQDPSGTNTISLASGDVTMVGNLQVGTSGAGNVTATYFIGNGSQLVGLPAGYANSDVAAYLPTYTGNISGNNVTLTGNVTAINASLGNLVTANYFSGAANLLSNIVGGNVTGQVANALVAGTVYTNAQPNITSVGTLSGLTVSGDSTITGNLTVSGSFEYANVTTFRVQDPIIEQGGKTDGTSLASNDGFDRGQLLHYFSGTAKDAFMGWDNSNAEFGFGSVVTVTDEVVTWTNYGNVRAGYFLGNGSQLTDVAAVTASSATTAGTVTTAAQPNITSVGTLTTLVVGNSTANVTITDSNGNGFMTATGNITAPYFIGNIVGNISGTLAVPGNNTAVLFNDAGSAGASDGLKFNKTSNVLTLTGNLTSFNANLGNLVVANYFSGDGGLLININGSNITSQVGNALVAGTVYTNAQPNITSVGTLVDLTVTGNISSGNANLGNLVTAGFFSGAGNLLSNIVGSNVTGQVANALVAGTVYTNAQPNITSTGTLVSLAVTGNTTTGNVKINGGIVSNRTSISVPAATPTIVDEFPTTTYRTAKYVVTAKGTDGYQSTEVLLVQDGTTSYITIYGALCSNATADLVEFSSNVDGVSGNARLYATTASASTTVNLVTIYVAD